MATLAPFQPATPAMIVGYGSSDEPLPLELGEPFALLGGDRLGPDGIPFLVMHEHQPDFLAWVRERCAAMLAAERPWFGGGALVLGGVAGAGRTHAARWLARVVGVPHAVLNLTDPVIAANVAASGEIGEAMGASPVTIAMATARCANPIVTVVGADRVGDDVLAGLAAMIDPERCRRWREDRLGIDVDLGEVTWILQRDVMRGIPSWVAPHADAVTFRPVTTTSWRCRSAARRWAISASIRAPTPSRGSGSSSSCRATARPPPRSCTPTWSMRCGNACARTTPRLTISPSSQGE